MELASNALKQHLRWLGVRSATPPLRLEPVNEKIPEGMSLVVTLSRFWRIVELGCTFYSAGGKALVAVWIVTSVIAMLAPRDLLFRKKKRSEGLRGILKVFWACAWLSGVGVDLEEGSGPRAQNEGQSQGHCALARVCYPLAVFGK
jgi:hypothetical protein